MQVTNVKMTSGPNTDKKCNIGQQDINGEFEQVVASMCALLFPSADETGQEPPLSDNAFNLFVDTVPLSIEAEATLHHELEVSPASREPVNKLPAVELTDGTVLLKALPGSMPSVDNPPPLSGNPVGIDTNLMQQEGTIGQPILQVPVSSGEPTKQGALFEGQLVKKEESSQGQPINQYQKDFSGLLIGTKVSVVPSESETVVPGQSQLKAKTNSTPSQQGGLPTPEIAPEEFIKKNQAKTIQGTNAFFQGEPPDGKDNLLSPKGNEAAKVSKEEELFRLNTGRQPAGALGDKGQQPPANHNLSPWNVSQTEAGLLQFSGGASRGVGLAGLRDSVLAEISHFISNHKGEPQTQVQLKLEPEHLGRLTIKLFFNRGELNAHFYTGNSSVKEVLEGSIQQLREALGQQELKLNEALVFTGDGGQEAAKRFYQEKKWRGTLFNAGHNHRQNGDVQVDSAGFSPKDPGSVRVNYLV